MLLPYGPCLHECDSLLPNVAGQDQLDRPVRPHSETAPAMHRRGTPPGIAYQGPDATLPVAGLTAWGEEGDPCNSGYITSNHVGSARLHSWKAAVHSWKYGHSLMPSTSRFDLLRQDCRRIELGASKQVQMRQENY